MADLHPEVLALIEEYVAGPPHGEARQKAALRRIALRAVELEREECAKVCEEEKVDADATGDIADHAYNQAVDHCAAAIRRRGKP